MAFDSKPIEVLYADVTPNMGESFFSLPGNITNSSGYSIQAVWTNGSSLSGSMNLQASNDSLNWTNIPNSTLPVDNNADTNIFNCSKQVFYNFVRLRYISTGGNGECVITLTCKG